VQGAISSVREIDNNRAKVQCRSIVIATRAPCVAYYAPRLRLLLIVGREYLVAQRVQRRCTVRDYLTRQDALSPSTYLDRLRSQKCNRLQRVIASAIQSLRNYRTTSRPAGEHTRQPLSNLSIVNPDRQLYQNLQPWFSLLIHTLQFILIHNYM